MLNLAKASANDLYAGQERHRGVTLAWLNKWRVRVTSLTMKPDKDERGFAEYKAKHVQRFAATGCPESGEVHGPENRAVNVPGLQGARESSRREFETGREPARMTPQMGVKVCSGF